LLLFCPPPFAKFKREQDAAQRVREVIITAGDGEHSLFEMHQRFRKMVADG
jgi:hypothetical protein